VQEAVGEIDNILVLAVFHDEDLVYDQVFLRLLLQIHLLDRHAPSRPDFICFENTAGRALADFIKVLIFRGGVGGIANLLQSNDNVNAAVRLTRFVPCSWAGDWADASGLLGVGNGGGVWHRCKLLLSGNRTRSRLHLKAW
jgi:hypothetical protein